MVRPEKIKLVPEFTILHPVVAMVIAPPDGLKVAVEELVRVPLMVKDEEVVTVAPEAIVILLKTRLDDAPPLLTIDPPSVKVIVPAVGARVLPELTVKAPSTEKEEVG
jgi:hypothetical protein